MAETGTVGNLGELRAVLSGGSDLAVGTAPLVTPALRALLDGHHAGRGIVLRAVRPGPQDAPNRIVLLATAEFLGSEMDAVLVATESAGGAPDLVLTLRPRPGWRLQAAFPQAGPAFDRLMASGALGDLAFVLPAPDPATVAAGSIGMTATLWPQRLTGVARALVTGAALALRGELQPGAAPLPRAVLTGELPGPVVLDRVRLAECRLRLSVPLAPVALGQPHPRPVSVTGLLRLSEGIGLDVDVAASLDAELFLARAVPTSPIAIGGDLGGDSDLLAAVPEPVRELLTAAPQLTLESVMIAAASTNGGSLALRHRELTVGVGTGWTLVEDLLTVQDVTVAVGLPGSGADPGHGPTVTVAGILRIAGVDCRLVGRWPGGHLDARMLPDQSVPLGALLAELLPGVPAPADLTVTNIAVSARVRPASVLIAATLDTADDFAIQLGHTTLALSRLEFRIGLGSGPAAGALRAVVVIAGTEIGISGERGAVGWGFHGGLLTGQSLPLGALLAELLLEGGELPEAVREAEVEGLAVSWESATGAVEVHGRVSSTWDLDLGPAQKSVTVDVEFSTAVDPRSGARTTRGRLAGTLDIGPATFALSYEFAPGRKVVRGTAEATGSMSYADLAAGLDLPVPEVDLSGIGPGLELQNVAFELDLNAAAGSGVVFSARSGTLGEALFAARRDARQQWGFVLGVAIPPDLSLTDLPGIGAELGELELDWLDIEQAAFLLSSAEFPALSVAGAPVLAAHATHVRPGLSLAVVIDLDGADEAGPTTKLAHLRTITGRPGLVVQLAVQRPLTRSALEASLGDLTIGPEGAQLQIVRARVLLHAGQGVSLAGSVVVELDGQVIEATGRLAIGLDGISAALAVRSDGVLFTPMGFKGVHLMEIGAMIDLGFRPPQLGFGLAGRFVIGDPPAPPPLPASPSDDLELEPESPPARPQDYQLDYRFAFALAVTATSVVPQLLSLYLEEISLRALSRAVLDEEIDLPDVLDGVRATEVLLYACKDVTLLPDGTMTVPGFGFNANLDLWGFHAHANLRIDRATGVVGTACVDPISIPGVLEISGTGAGTPGDYRGRRGVAPGGPFLHVSTLSSPFFQISWHVTLLSTFRQELEVQVTDQGFVFDLDVAVGDLDEGTAAFTAALHCRLRDRTRFDAHFALDLDLDLDLGFGLPPLHLVSAGADVRLDAQLGERVVIGLAAEFRFEDEQFTLPRAELDFVPASIAELPGIVAAGIADAAGELFDAVIAEVRELIEEGKRIAAEIADGVDAAVEEISAAADAAVAAIGDAADAAVRAIEDGAEAALAALENAADELVAGAAELKAELSSAMDEVADTVAEAGREAERIAEGFGEAASDAAGVAVAAGESVLDTAKDVSGAIEAGAGKVLGRLGGLF